MSPPSSAIAGPSGTTTGSTGESRYAKLDGVLYHFYSKTSAVITSTRLTHFEPSDALTGSSSTSSRNAQARRNASDSYGGTPIGTPVRTSSSGKKPSKWFALEIDDHDVFRDEVRLWRNISSMLPASVLDGEPVRESAEPYVPSLMLDVILDTSQLSTKHVLMVDEVKDGTGAKRRVRVDGLDLESSDPHDEARARADVPLDTQRQSIVLESWKLDFKPGMPSVPPELPALYKQATAHFREVYAKITSLPAYNLHQRLKEGWQGTLERQKSRAGSMQNVDHDDNEVEEELSSLLKIGVRLAIGQPANLDDGQVPIDEPLQYEQHRGIRSANEITDRQVFESIVSPIGDMSFSVVYRRNVDFYVENWHVVQSLREIALDEDYFKPTMAKHLQKRSLSQRTATSSNLPTPNAVPLSPVERSKSLLSVTSRQSSQVDPIDNLSNADPQLPSSLEQTGVRGPVTTNNVFATSTQASGRLVAGLSSLRANPSISSFSASPSAANVFGHSTTASGTASPALASALSSDAAFLTQARRSSSSASERRARVLAQTSAMEQTPATSQTSAQASTSIGRPILNRAAVSAFSRSGSYSPSSPSPLAQQMWAQQNAALVHANAQATGRLSSSPSFRAVGGFASSISPSLRSVFQTYTPSQSQTSASSLSRTPPRSLVEAAQAQTSTDIAGSPSMHGSSSSPRQPTVGPQMIKRYSSTFRYRHGKHDASTGSDGGASSGSGTGGAMYSKSWQARIEQRQSFAGRSLERASYSASSPLAARQHSQYAASSNEPEEDLDDLVRMLESKPDLRQHDDQAQTKASHLYTQSVQGDVLDPNLSTEPALPTPFLPRSGGYKRSQIDDMLNKMQNSMRDLSTSMATNRSSPASGGAATSSSGPQSHQESSPSFYPTTTTSTGGRSPTTMRSPLGKETGPKPPASIGAAHMEAILSGDGLSAESSARLDASSSTDAAQTSKGRMEADEAEEDETYEVRDIHQNARMTRSHPGRTRSRGSLELYGGTVHSYDPLEDETAGRLELAGDEQNNDELSNVATAATTAGGAYCPPGLHARAGHVMRSTGVAPSSANLMDDVGHQRPTNYELARNFRSTSNGRSTAMNAPASRANVSPWRVRQYHTAATADGIAPANVMGHPQGAAAQYRHGRLVGQNVQGTRSGPTSAGPTSRATSPLLSD